MTFNRTLLANELTNTAQKKFFNAVRNDNVEIVEKMIGSGFDIEMRDRNNRTALLIATHANAIKVAGILMMAGADVNAMDNIQDSPFLYAGAEGRLEILRMTLANGADLDSVNRYGGTALIPAAHHGHIETVRVLLKTAINIDHINYLGWTALLETIILGDGGPTYIEIARQLINAGADITISDGNNVSPLEHAVASGYTEIAGLLSAAR